MPPTLALFLTIAFVVYLFRRDMRERPPVTGALWIPLVFMLIIGSRLASEWLGFGGATDLAEGSPLDSAVFLALEIAGIVVLVQRRVSFSTVTTLNVAMTVFLAFGLISIVWSDFPYVAFKRWFKVLMHPIMVLVLATEPDPREALIRLIKRAAYVLVPFSIMLIKYYPETGRGFSEWTGDAFNVGVTSNKNALGYLCFLLTLFFAWQFLVTLRRPRGPERKRELLLCGAFLYMLGWLLVMANSATALMALVVGASIIIFLGTRLVDRNHVAIYLAAALLFLTCLDTLFGVTDMLITALGREATLTGRMELWEDVLSFNINPVVGVGFESFWLGPRAEWLANKHWWRPNQAHNGYLETYLNLGTLGVILLAAWIFAAFRKASRTLLEDLDLGRFQLALIGGIVV